MGILDHVICLLRNLYANQEATVRTGHGTTDWFQIGKGVCSLGGLMLKLKLQYFGHLMGRADSFEKTLIWERLNAGGDRDNRG